MQPGHHGPQIATNLLYLMLRTRAPHSQEAGTTGLILQNPARGERAILNFTQYVVHLLAYMLIDDARAGDVIAIFGGIADGVAHIVHTTLIEQIDDQFHLVHTFEVGNFRLIASFYERFKTCADQRSDATTQHRLLAEEIGLGLLSDGRAQN